MKATVVFCLACLVILVGSLTTVVVADKTSNGFPEIKAKALTIVNEKGEAVISMVSTKDGPGIWLNRPNGDVISINALESECSVYLMKKGADVANIAISIDGDGAGVLQFRDKKGKIRFFSLENFSN